MAAAVGPDLRYVRVRQGDDRFWLGKGTLKTGAARPVRGRSRKRRARARRLALPRAVRRAAGRRSAAFAAAGYEHRVVAWDEVGEDEGTGIVHIAPGCGAEDFQLGKALGLPVIAPIDEDGRYFDGFGWLTGLDAPDVAEPIVDDLERRGLLLPPRAVHATATRTAGAAARRCCSGSSTSGSSPWARSTTSRASTLTPEQVDASLRYQIMEVVDQIRWIPDFGYERELDWLRNMHDWMISKKRYWGLALPIYDCRRAARSTSSAGARSSQERAVAGWEAFEGHTPHRPYVDAVKIACSGCGEPVARIPDVGNPWLDAGIVPFSTMHYREDPEYWAKWFPADFITESFPGQFRNWFYSMLAMSHRAPARGAVQDDLRLRHALRRGRPADAQELGQRDRVRRGGRADGRRRHALDVRQGAAGGQHPLRLARGRRGAARAARPVERVRVLRDLRAAGRLDAARPARPAVAEPARRSTAGSCRASAGVAAAVEDRLRDSTPSAATRARRRVHRRPVDLVPAPLAPAVLAHGRRARTGTPRSRRSTRRSSRSCRILAPILPFLADAMYGNLVVGRRRRPRPTAST